MGQKDDRKNKPAGKRTVPRHASQHAPQGATRGAHRDASKHAARSASQHAAWGSSQHASQHASTRAARNASRRTSGRTPRHVRLSVTHQRTGALGLIPKSALGRGVLIFIFLLVLAVVIFNSSTAAKSIADPNYYDDPVQEFRADLIDRIADGMKSETPDSSNAKIDAKREQLTGRSKWANTVIDAEQYWGVSTDATKLIIAMIEVESGGDETSVANGNIMQLESGTDAFEIFAGGVPDAGVSAWTPESSIYAGTYVTGQCIGCFTDSFGVAPDLTYIPQEALLAQGYNYGYYGWITWCANNGLTEWSLWASETYQAQYMNGGGTVNHGQKVMDVLETL